MQVTCKGAIYYRDYGFEAPNDPTQFEFWPCATLSHLGPKVCDYAVTLEVPDNFDPRPGKIANLQEQLRVARAEFERVQTKTLRQIAELQAIEYVQPNKEEVCERVGLAPIKREGGPIPEEM